MNYPQRMRLSPHFTLNEALKSDTAQRKGLDNNPPIELIPVLCHTAFRMERVRLLLGGNGVVASSWYRGPALNAEVKGSSTSQHVKGEAVDFNAIGVATATAALRISRSDIPFDQLILEYPDGGSPWVHISFAFDGTARRDVRHKLRGSAYLPGFGSFA